MDSLDLNKTLGRGIARQIISKRPRYTYWDDLTNIWFILNNHRPINLRCIPVTAPNG